MGSAPNAAATADPQPPHPASQGYVQMLGVFMDTIVICTCTASIILVSGQFDPTSELTGIQLTQNALSSQVGGWGSAFIAVAVFLFSFTSIVADYSYGEINIVFLKESRAAVRVYRIAVLGMVLFGSFATLPLVWALADVAMGLMALLNIVAIVMLSRTAFALADDFDAQLANGVRPTFRPEDFPELRPKLQAGVWEADVRNQAPAPR